MKRRVCFFIVLMMFTVLTGNVRGEGLDGVEAKSCILTEQSTGEVLYEMNADEQLPIASVTKIMTMLIIMEKIDSGALSLDDMVTVSENAMSYGGSTMFLETGETLSVNDMLKGIAVASANDGAVAMAEHIAGSETSFVDMMNGRAAELGMTNTHFMNTNGLDEDNHYSSARDVAIMSSELLKHPQILNYTSIWTDELRGGKFQLANTNRLIRFYSGANGLKTGSTNSALCCLSASALRDNMQLIAVVLGAPTSDKRFASAKALLDYGFANYRINKTVESGEEVGEIQVINGVSESVKAVTREEKSYLENKSGGGDKERKIYIDESVKAPVEEGAVIGHMDIVSGEEIIDTLELCTANSVDKKSYTMIAEELIVSLMGMK